jgi:N-acetylmuramoyl-L-alanine amidase CwlA
MLMAGATKSLDLWLDVIEGRRHPLSHGYYCTRQANDDERSTRITNAKTRELEAKFFRDTPPWSKSSHSDRFGTPNLIATLSRLLVSIINET